MRHAARHPLRRARTLVALGQPVRVPPVCALAAAFTLCACAPATPSLLEGTALALRGHDELATDGRAHPLPVVFGPGRTLALCLQAPPEVDSSQWEARIAIASEGGDPAWRPPDARAGVTSCFETTLPADLDRGEHELCLTLRDRFDGRTSSADCLAFELRESDPGRDALRDALAETLAREIDPLAAASAFEALERQAEAAGHPLLALRMRLIAIFQLRRAGDAPSLARAEERLAAVPAWLDSAAASAQAAQVAYERASLDLQAGYQLERAWDQLERAEAAYRRIADPRGLAVVMKRAEILARVGAVNESRRRLRQAIESCATEPCDARLLAPAGNTLAWLTLLDPEAAHEDLANSAARLEQIAAEQTSSDPLERANVWVNLAYVRALLDEDPRTATDRARSILDADGLSGSSRADLLESWLALVEARAAHGRGEADRALGSCRALAASAPDPRLAAAAASCAGELLRLAGDRAAAGEAFERALLLHEHATPRSLGQSVPLGPSQRAEDFYLAARNAVERGDVAGAWRLLGALDALVEREGARARCEEPKEGERPSPKQELLAQLARLELPASAARRAQIEPIKRELMQRLQEAERSDPDCAAPVLQAADGDLDYRAVPLADEILLLRQSRPGQFELYRRTPFSREELLRTTREIEAALAAGAADSETWSTSLARLSSALVPRPEDLDPLTTFALYGTLQRVPLAALPLEPTRPDGPLLADATVVAHRPAGASVAATHASTLAGRPLFVVDPTQDLAGAREARALYERLFPDAVVLAGAGATAAALRRELPDASWLHVDAHAHFDPAFPELSTLRMADGGVLSSDLRLVGPSFAFANLSACRSGDFPVTADSGRYGLAGWLSRRGVPWVIGSRADLADALARDFNAAFYTELAAGREVPVAHGAALRAVRKAHSAASWGALVLLEAASSESGGQSAALRTPNLSAEVSQ